ncbi:RimJ/RimL family protein N-acetyltransferase [Kineococcus xinjiangensis]|uniref:RimJ/RimL family protein N-acetyltransferase n=1 Tax=Kineococcus xinjiangensis TaxID=512762 RepID=A0A2S6IT87_9ACTN|nr:GNAT family N-acetyltransferase [Kineococcus xinjiangensis]PPK97474.1 RimJ/RimL family protein N-acetyltransferase [Kineococcus xinjiangensis]
MPALRETVTERLLLTAVGAGDVEELHALHADPAVWEHLPSGRHTERAQTEAMVRRAVQGWEHHGLDIWALRPRAGEGPRPLLGVGGCTLRFGAAWNVAAWNLYYRLARGQWGRGYAQELIAAARDAATALEPGIPVVAYLLEHNEGSRRAAERAGLDLVWRGPDAGNPDPAAVRLVYADRPLGRSTLALFTET